MLIPTERQEGNEKVKYTDRRPTSHYIQFTLLRTHLYITDKRIVIATHSIFCNDIHKCVIYTYKHINNGNPTIRFATDNLGSSSLEAERDN